MAATIALPHPIGEAGREKPINSMRTVDYIISFMDNFDAAISTTDDVTAVLSRSGGCILRSLMLATDMAHPEEDTRLSMDADAPW